MADESLIIRPGAQRWRGLVAPNTSATALQFRRELGLPTDRPVVMTGHQAQFWHPGILAKYLAADALAEGTKAWGHGGTEGRDAEALAEGTKARRHAGTEEKDGETERRSDQGAGAAVAFLVVDQDRPRRIGVRYPVVEALGNLGVREVAYTAAGLERPAEGRVAAGFVQEGLVRIDDAMRLHRGPDLAHTVALAARDLMAPSLGEAGRNATMLFATGLSRTRLFRELVERMAREPERCIGAYNAAAAAHPGAGIRALHADEVQDRWELPLWWLPRPAAGAGGSDGRRHVYAEELGTIPPEELAPKALFMTGLLRLAGCDLFIHGTGGAGEEGYDVITEQWLRTWLGEEARLAPVALVTATRLLPLRDEIKGDGEDPLLAQGALMALWRAHHALHVPGELGLGELEEQRRALVGEIAVAEPRVRVGLFRDLHRMLERYRAEHARELEGLARAAAAARARAGDAAIVADRTWAFPLYPAGVLGGLREEIRASFGLG